MCKKRPWIIHKADCGPDLIHEPYSVQPLTRGNSFGQEIMSLQKL